VSQDGRRSMRVKEREKKEISDSRHYAREKGKISSRKRGPGSIFLHSKRGKKRGKRCHSVAQLRKGKREVRTSLKKKMVVFSIGCKKGKEKKKKEERRPRLFARRYGKRRERLAERRQLSPHLFRQERRGLKKGEGKKKIGWKNASKSPPSLEKEEKRKKTPAS